MVASDLLEATRGEYDRSWEVPMAVDLSDEQRQTLEAGRAVAIHDGPRTYYVISRAQFEKVKKLLDVEEADPSLYEAGDIHLYNDQ